MRNARNLRRDMRTYTDEVWAEVRQRYESGETAGQIAKTPGFPTKQAINRRAKRDKWERNLELVPVGDGGTVRIPTDLDPRKRAALLVLSDGGNYKDAARAAHVSEETFRLWRKDPKYLALVLAVQSELKIEMLRHVRSGAARDPKHAEWMLTHHPSMRHEFGDRPQTTQIGSIRIGNIVPRSLPGVTIDQDVEPVAIGSKAVEVDSLAEQQQIEHQESVKAELLVAPSQAQEKQIGSGRDRCPDCGQVPHPGYPHQCLSKRGLPV